MQIAHVIPDSNKSVIESYVKFINENFKRDNHYFYIFTNGKPLSAQVQKYPNVKILSVLSSYEIKKILKNHDKIILHYLKLKTSQMLKFLLQPNIFNKIIWVAWGVDLYQWNKNIEGNIFDKEVIRIRNIIGLLFRKKINNFVGIFPPDIDYFKKEFNSEAKTFYASYISNLLFSKDKEDLVSINLEDKIITNEQINIQIGHSSTNVLNHIDVLNVLEKYKEENIKIFLPLNYGDMSYGEIVQKKAIEIFGDKAICIREMMPIDKYLDYLSKIDIAIFNTTRQIGLGNISPLLYMDKKIFLPKGSVMYDFYKSQHVDVWDYNEIANLDYNEYVQPLRYKGGRKYITYNELNLEHKIDMWKNVFEAPLK